MHHGEEELRATGRSPSNTWPWREGAGRRPCIWRSLLLVHTQQSVNCHALQRTSLSALYTYVTINTLIIFSTFSNGRGVARGLPSALHTPTLHTRTTLTPREDEQTYNYTQTEDPILGEITGTIYGSINDGHVVFPLFHIFLFLKLHTIDQCCI